jgi:hypothetical protein
MQSGNGRVIKAEFAFRVAPDPVHAEAQVQRRQPESFGFDQKFCHQLIPSTT